MSAVTPHGTSLVKGYVILERLVVMISILWLCVLSRADNGVFQALALGRGVAVSAQSSWEHLCSWVLPTDVGVQLLGHVVNLCFNFLRNCPVVFQRGRIVVHASQL